MSYLCNRGGEDMKTTSEIKQPIAWALALLLAVLATGLIASTASGQDDGISVYATVDKETLRAGETAVLSITVEGVTDCDVPPAPRVDGLDIRYVGPSTQVRWVSGSVTQSISFRYTIQSTRIGTYRIPAVEVNVGGKTYRTEPLDIEVVASTGTRQQQRSGSGEPLSLLLEPEKTVVYPGETIELKLTLLIDNARVTEVTYPQLDAVGFLIDEFSEPTQGKRTVNGRSLQTLEFVTNITPAVTGELVIGPATMQCEIRVPAQSRDPFDDFFSGGFPDFDSFFDSPFFSRTTTNVTVESEPLVLSVRPFPDEGRPSTFSGAVGKFTVVTSATPTTVKVGDPINLRIEVSGEGNVRSVTPPRIHDSDQFKTYDPVVKSVSKTQKVLEQVLIVKDPTVSEIPAVSLAYFNPAAQQYEIATSAPIPITVIPAPARADTGGQAVSQDAQVKLKSPLPAQTGLLYIKKAPGELVLLSDPLRSSGWLTAAAVFVSLLLAASIAISWYRRTAKERTPGKQRARAFQAALAAVDELESQISWRDSIEIINDAKRALMSLIKAVEDKGRERSAIADEVLRQLDILSYSPVSPSREQVKEALQRCKQAIESMGNREGKTEQRRNLQTTVLLLLLPALLILSMGVPASASTAGKDAAIEFFYKGNAHYEQGDYALAVDMYRQAIAQGYVSGNLYYNLGNALAKTGSYAEALVNYLRAAEFIPRDRDLQHNIEFVLSEVGLESTGLLSLGGMSRLDQVVRRFTQSEWAIAAVAMYALFSCLVAWRLLLAKKAAPPPALIALVGCLFAITAFGALYRRDLYLNDQRIVVTAEEAQIRFEPNASAAVRYQASAGSILFRAGEQMNGFLVVEDKNGQLGWVEVSAVQPVRQETR